jgi:CheY-like chemotaxis protein
LREKLPPAHVLIVDDNARSRAILEQYTTVWGLQPHTVATGEEALGEMRRCQAAGESLDAAVIDMKMPGMDGAALAREIARDSALPGISPIYLNVAGVMQECSRGEIRLSKPVKPSALFEALSRILRRIPAMEEESHKAEPVAKTEVQPVVEISTDPVPGLADLPSSGRGRILIAEDNPVNQRVASLQVKRCGYESDVVGNGEEALEALERLAYALVLMDCQMPGMDGYAATRELRRRENGARHTPVIALTANAFSTDREACLAAGMDDHLAKPVNMRNLAALLQRWCPAETEVCAQKAASVDGT